MFFPLDYYISELEGLWGQWTFWSLFFVLTDTRSMCYMVCSVDPSQNTASRTKKEKKRKQSPLPFTAPSSSSLLIWGSTIILSLLQLPAELQTQAVSCLVLQTSQSLSGIKCWKSDWMWRLLLCATAYRVHVKPILFFIDTMSVDCFFLLPWYFLFKTWQNCTFCWCWPKN